jgi:hypothetical protein
VTSGFNSPTYKLAETGTVPVAGLEMVAGLEAPVATGTEVDDSAVVMRIFVGLFVGFVVFLNLI